MPASGGTPMTSEMIAIAAGSLPAFLFVAALFCASLRLSKEAAAERLLSWILLLPIGVAGLWAALFHIVLPERTAALIGWPTSPFQFQLGVADLAIGVTGCLAFRRSLGFKAASVIAASVLLLGDALGHLRQMLVTGNFSAGSAGVPFVMDLVCPIFLIILLVLARRTVRVMSSRQAAMALRARL
jgi:hypothetical protein